MLPAILLLVVLGFIEASSITQLGMMIKYIIDSNSNSTESDTGNTENAYIINISNIVNTSLQCLHVIEYLVLIISLSKLIICNKNTLTCKKCCSTLFGCNVWKMVTVIILLSIVFTILVFWPPITYTVYYSSVDNNAETFSLLTESDVETVAYNNAFNVLIFVAHFSNWIIRIVLMLVTIKVIAKWKTTIQGLSECSSPHDQSIEWLTEVYTSAGEDVSLYKEIFQPWFVVQWIIYFTPITVNFILVFNGSGRLQTTLYVSYTIYNLSAFIFPYICGIAMNYYHKQCHREIRKRIKTLLLQNANDVIKLWQNVDLIPRNPDFHFIPSFFGIINIPINTTGHALTIFLTLLSFLLSLLNK